MASAAPSDINTLLSSGKSSIQSFEARLANPSLNYANLDFERFKNFAESLAKAHTSKPLEIQQKYRHLLGKILITALGQMTEPARVQAFLSWYQNYGQTDGNSRVFRLMTTPTPSLTSKVSTVFAKVKGAAAMTTKTDQQIGIALKAAAARLKIPLAEAPSVEDSRARIIYTPSVTMSPR